MGQGSWAGMRLRHCGTRGFGKRSWPLLRYFSGCKYIYIHFSETLLGTSRDYDPPQAARRALGPWAPPKRQLATPDPVPLTVGASRPGVGDRAKNQFSHALHFFASI